MQILFGKIKNFSYQKFWRKELKTFNLNHENIDINDLPSKCYIQINNKIISLSKWVSPNSRYKAKSAQNREVLTLHNKESVGIGEKTKIEIENYLGGYYYFTIDDVLDKNNILYLIESKHSKNSILPSNDDIKDGLLKLMLYNNLCEIRDLKTKRDFKIVLRLTSNTLKSNVDLPNNNLESFMKSNKLNKKQIEIIYKLNSECERNKFYIWIQKA